MGDMIKCPSCCDQLFASKADLVQHLAPLQGDITCPVCTNKCPSLGHLIEHLTLDECSSIYELESYGLVEETQHNDFTSESMETFKPKLDLDDPLSGTKTEPDATIDTEDGKMYVEFLSKQQTRPYLQTQEVKLVKDNGVSRFVFVTQDDTDVDSESTIVTKQNNDGTISLTSVKDMPLESGSDTLITQESDAADNDEEIYSCNTCGVTFTSVLDHIQNYHNDQEVVVEEPMDEGVDSESVEWDAMSMESHTKEPPQNINERRMITDTGDIVQVPVLKTTSITLESLVLNNLNQSGSLLEQQIKKDPSPPNHTPYVGVVKSIKNSDQLEFAVVKNIKEPETKGGPYHKVVVKEMTAVTGQKTRIFQCISCNVHVTRLDDFKSKPCKTLRYQCVHCPVAYENSKSLCAHMKVHKEKGAEIISNAPSSYGCEVCLTVFTTNKSLKLHKRMHDPIKERPIEPPLVTAEGGEVSGDKYLCQVCHKLIPIDYRTIHQNSHKNIEKFNCDICNKKFSSKEYLVMHLGVHNMDKVTVCKQDESLPYLCVYCDRRFARPHEKVKHERIHTGEKPHSCEICGKSFRVSYCLTLHMRTHTGARPYACHHCGKRFKAHSVYNHHLLTHSDVRAYKCPYCPKAFKTSVQLAGHKNSHTKPFSCQYCNRPFASLYAVRIHTETHARQNNLKFSCTICGASYARAFALKDHVKQAHKEEDQVAEGNDGETILELT